MTGPSATGPSFAAPSATGPCTVDPEPVVDPRRIPYERCPWCDAGVERRRFLRDQSWAWRADYSPELHPVIRWVACEGCGHQFTSGYHDAVAEGIVFARPQPGQSPEGMRAAQVEASRNVWAKVVESVGRVVPEGSWLDVGAGSGMLLALASECGYDAAAVEMRESTAAALRARGLHVASTLDGGPWSSYDVVSLCDVLEHVAWPRQFLRAAVGLVAPGGCLFLSSPNRDSLAWEALDGENVNPYWSEIEHFHNFSFRQIRGELLDLGLGPVTCTVSNRYRLGMDVLAVRR